MFEIYFRCRLVDCILTLAIVIICPLSVVIPSYSFVVYMSLTVTRVYCDKTHEASTVVFTLFSLRVWWEV